MINCPALVAIISQFQFFRSCWSSWCGVFVLFPVKSVSQILSSISGCAALAFLHISPHFCGLEQQRSGPGSELWPGFKPLSWGSAELSCKVFKSKYWCCSSASWWCRTFNLLCRLLCCWRSFRRKPGNGNSSRALKTLLASSLRVTRTIGVTWLIPRVHPVPAAWQEACRERRVCVRWVCVLSQCQSVQQQLRKDEAGLWAGGWGGFEMFAGFRVLLWRV